MKKTIYFLLVAVSFFSCKRNSEIDELGKNESSQYPPHCFNKIKDQDETGIDCGGKCEACTSGAPATHCRNGNIEQFPNNFQARLSSQT